MVLVIVMAASEEVRLRGMTSNKVWMGELSLRTPPEFCVKPDVNCELLNLHTMFS